MIWPAPEHGGAHFAGRRANISREKFLVLEINVYGIDEILAVEKRADRNLDSDHSPLKLKNLNFIRKSFLVSLQHADHILPVIFFPDEKAPLHVLRLSARLDHVAARILRNVYNRLVE